MHKDQPELSLPGEGISESVSAKVDTIRKLLPTLTSLGVVSEFLKGRGIHHSAGSWEEMHTKRILPALRKGKISIVDLTRLMGEAEEFGRAHTFLYQAKKVDIKNYIEAERISRLCEKLGYSEAFSNPLIVDLPELPTLSEVREEQGGEHKCWVFKIVETRREKNI